MPSEELFELRWVCAIAVVVALLLPVLDVQAQQEQGENLEPDSIESTEDPTSEDDESQADSDVAEDASTEDTVVASDRAETSDGSTSVEESPPLESVETPDFFDPTEEISEDYAVPFPVDI